MDVWGHIPCSYGVVIKPSSWHTTYASIIEVSNQMGTNGFVQRPKNANKDLCDKKNTRFIFFIGSIVNISYLKYIRRINSFLLIETNKKVENGISHAFTSHFLKKNTKTLFKHTKNHFTGPNFAVLMGLPVPNGRSMLDAFMLLLGHPFHAFKSHLWF